MKLLVLHGSSRTDGNTELLAQRVTAGLPATHVVLRERHIEAIVDKRHDPAGFHPVADDHDAIIQQVIDHDILIFATPLYWYGMSGVMKDFVDRWSQSSRDPRFDFKGAMRTKQAWVLVTGGSDARFKGLPLILQFKHIFDFVGTEFAGYIIGTGGRPGDIMKDERTLLEADWLNRTLKSQLG